MERTKRKRIGKKSVQEIKAEHRKKWLEKKEEDNAAEILESFTTTSTIETMTKQKKRKKKFSINTTQPRNNIILTGDAIKLQVYNVKDGIRSLRTVEIPIGFFWITNKMRRNMIASWQCGVLLKYMLEAFKVDNNNNNNTGGGTKNRLTSLSVEQIKTSLKKKGGVELRDLLKCQVYDPEVQEIVVERRQKDEEKRAKIKKIRRSINNEDGNNIQNRNNWEIKRLEKKITKLKTELEKDKTKRHKNRWDSAGHHHFEYVVIWKEFLDILDKFKPVIRVITEPETIFRQVLSLLRNLSYDDANNAKQETKVWLKEQLRKNLDDNFSYTSFSPSSPFSPPSPLPPPPPPSPSLQPPLPSKNYSSTTSTSSSSSPPSCCSSCVKLQSDYGKLENDFLEFRHDYYCLKTYMATIYPDIDKLYLPPSPSTIVTSTISSSSSSSRRRRRTTTNTKKRKFNPKKYKKKHTSSNSLDKFTL